MAESKRIRLMIGLGFFGLLCGICYWHKECADKESVG
jgi:hypothetical protein